MEPPNPEASTKSRPDETGKGGRVCDTARYPQQSPFVKGASRPPTGCDSTSFPLAQLAHPLQIRPDERADWPPVWARLEPMFRVGETFPHDPAISEAQAQVAWVQQNQIVTVAVDAAGVVVGTYSLKAIALALGAHGANAGYVVATHCRRQGIGSRLSQHSLQAARRLGFRVVNTLPGGGRHRQLGYADALVMVQGLETWMAHLPKDRKSARQPWRN
jgi:predicted N-acetyltransferase YhbS